MDNNQVQIHVVRMGICELLILQTKSEAEKLRLLIREKRGRVGPLFRPDGWEGHTGFFNYSRRLLATLLRDHPRYCVLDGPSSSGSVRACRPGGTEFALSLAQGSLADTLNDS